MNRKHVTVILGHPDNDTWCRTLAETYAKGAESAGARVRRIRLADLSFDPILHKGYKTIQPLEPDLLKAQRDIAWANHLVFVYPMWWGSMPALLKGFLDRVFHPGFGFQFDSDTSYTWKKLLCGRSARLIITMDGPPRLIRLLYKDPAVHMMKGMTLEFCGISPVRVTEFGPVKRATRARRLLWKLEAEDLGRALK
ncbi:MAG: NAD(P)H-dependent oxidoreductase [Candidatus Hydrogenedentota bacterium]